MRLTGLLRSFFARREDPYAGGDLERAHRIGAVIWALLVALAVILVPLNPPTDVVGAAGWAIAALLILGGGAASHSLWRGRIGGLNAMLALSYATVVAITVLQWFSGGLTAPYRGLLLPLVLFVASVQPPRRIAPFMAVVLVALAAPFVYDSWDATRAESTAATFVIWCGLAVGASLMMGGIRVQRLALEAEGREARAEARIDSLTGLRNRRAFDELLAREVGRTRQLDLPLTMAMVDIVDFKQVNDRWSYAEGDRCLSEVAAALQRNLRQPNLCFRWGGDEYAIILSGTPADETGPIEERLKAEVSRSCRRPDQSPIRIRFAAVELSRGVSPRELTEMTGHALTAAKLDDDQTAGTASSR